MVPQCPVIPVTPSRIFQLVTLGFLTWFLFFFKSVGGASPQSEVFRQSLGLSLSCGSGLSEVCFGFPATTSEGGNGPSEAGNTRLMQ